MSDPHDATPALVLVVDDSDAGPRPASQSTWSSRASRCAPAADGLEALEVVRGVAAPDVITLDVVMPRLDGFDTLARLRADPATAAIPVVIVTGRAQAADRARGEALARRRLPHQAVRARPSWSAVVGPSWRYRSGGPAADTLGR